MGNRTKALLGVAALALGTTIVVLYLRLNWQPRFPETPFPAIIASQTPALVSEGEYLVKAVAHCTNCHLPKQVVVNASVQAASKFLPTGGGEWDMGPVGIFRSPNLTSDRETGIGEWSDAEIARAIRYGIDRHGRALFYMVGVGPMDDRDLRAIVSYLRTLPAVRTPMYQSEISNSGRDILRTQMQGLLRPKPEFPVTYVPRGDASIGRGAYLANGPAMCFGCHSQLQFSPGLAVEGPRFAGSFQPEPDPDHPEMEINAPNLTPSASYGVLRELTEEDFVARVRAGRIVKNSPMPWENFRLMTDADLLSIFSYLRSLEPVDRDVGPSYRPVGWKAEIR